MIYTKMTKLAMKISFDGHRDQVDKTGLPYVFHPFHLAECMNDEAAVVVALLHDVIEDTDMTAERLLEVGISKECVDAISLMTHAPEVPYMDYVKEIKKNPIARAVKIADLRHNSDMTRLDVIDEYAIKRAEKYKAALELLLED